MTGVAVSHVSHALSVFLLWMLSGAVLGSETASQRTWCLISAALHVMSPAGAFLSAPYSESVFACVHFLGLYLYSIALRADHAGYLVRRDACWVAAGIAFAVATLIRSNGILSGCLFAYDAMEAGMEWLSRGLSVGLLRRMLFIGLGGGIIAVAMVGAQFVGYLSYCTATDPPRPWCRQLVPSIYNWVQSHYWFVGPWSGVEDCGIVIANSSQECWFLEVLDLVQSTLVPARGPHVGSSRCLIPLRFSTSLGHETARSRSSGTFDAHSHSTGSPCIPSFDHIPRANH